MTEASEPTPTTIEAVQDMEVEACNLLRGFMLCLQYTNDCRQTGHACRDNRECGCVLEIEEWCQKKQ